MSNSLLFVVIHCPSEFPVVAIYKGLLGVTKELLQIVSDPYLNKVDFENYPNIIRPIYQSISIIY